MTDNFNEIEDQDNSEDLNNIEKSNAEIASVKIPKRFGALIPINVPPKKAMLYSSTSGVIKYSTQYVIIDNDADALIPSKRL